LLLLIWNVHWIQVAAQLPVPPIPGPFVIGPINIAGVEFTKTILAIDQVGDAFLSSLFFASRSAFVFRNKQILNVIFFLFT
jgi:hypothetical protein